MKSGAWLPAAGFVRLLLAVLPARAAPGSGFIGSHADVFPVTDNPDREGYPMGALHPQSESLF